MIEEEGIVIEVEGKMARVSVLKKSACESCAAAGVCHPQDADRSFIVADNPLKAVKGQKVKLVLTPQSYLNLSIIQYGIPLSALVGCAIIAKNLSKQYGGETYSDLWAFFCGITGMLVSFVLLRVYTKHVEKTPKYKPVIVEILA